MSTNLYTPETAKWYNLLNRAQADTNHYFEKHIERYIADMLFRSGCDADGTLISAAHAGGLDWSPARENRLIRLQGAAEKCLVTAGFFPEHANYAGLSLMHFIDAGRSAYRDLDDALPDSAVYGYINRHFVNIVDVLQTIGELSGVCRPIDLIQACELWQHAGSRFAYELVRRKTASIPAFLSSNATH